LFKKVQAPGDAVQEIPLNVSVET